MYRIIRDGQNKIIGIEREKDGAAFCADRGCAEYREFLAWNALRSEPEDISTPVDADMERIRQIVAKPDSEIMVAERWEAVLKFIRRRL